jgi:hypothetical protein
MLCTASRTHSARKRECSTYFKTFNTVRYKPVARPGGVGRSAAVKNSSRIVRLGCVLRHLLDPSWRARFETFSLFLNLTLTDCLVLALLCIMTSVSTNNQKSLSSFIYVDDSDVPLETSIPKFSSIEDLIAKLSKTLKLTISKVEWTDSRTKPACLQYHDLFWSEVVSNLRPYICYCFLLHSFLIFWSPSSPPSDRN